MAIPQLSPEERQAALEKAKAARIKRAEVRDDLKSGKLTLEKVLEMKNDPVVGRMKVSTLIETLPGYGKAKAEKIMKELQIAESRRLRGLGERQQPPCWSAWANRTYAPRQSVRHLGAIGCWQGHAGGPSFARDPRCLGVHVGYHTQAARGRSGWRPLPLRVPSRNSRSSSTRTACWNGRRYGGNCYGTPRATVEEHIACGDQVILEIDVQGGFQVRDEFPSAHLVFIELAVA